MHPTVHNLRQTLADTGGMMGLSPEHAKKLQQAATVCRDAGQLIAAAHGFRRAANLVWGHEHRELLDDATAAALECLNTTSACWQARVLASQWALHSLSMSSFGSAAQAKTVALQLTKAEIMLSESSGNPLSDGLLVGGVQVATDLESVHVHAPEFGVSLGGGAETWSFSQDICVEVTGAAETLLALGDFERAWEVLGPLKAVAERTGRLGWYHASHGSAVPSEGEVAFLQAALAFEADGPEHARARNQAWTSVFRDLRAPYFRSRSRLARIPFAPSEAPDLIVTASEALGREPGMWLDAEVEHCRLALNALSDLVTNGRIDLDELHSTITEARFLDTTDERFKLVVGFATHAASGLQALREGSVSAALQLFVEANELLRRLPIIGPLADKGISDCVLSSALADAPLPRSTLHDRLEGLATEDQLRRVLLRLLREQAPLHAQITHGPVEYGKDLVVAHSREGRTILHMYQAKLGNITLANVGRIREQVDTMFQVPYQSVQLPAEPDERIGVVVFNGHIQPHADPVIAGWVAEQKRVHGRTIEFMNIDRIVDFILTNRLHAGFRAALVHRQDFLPEAILHSTVFRQLQRRKAARLA